MSMADIQISPECGIDARPYWQDRDLSWLSFAERVLDQAYDDTVPLLERLRFMSIYQSDLIRFIEQRMGSFQDKVNSYKAMKERVSASKMNDSKKAKKRSRKAAKELKRLYEKIGEMAPRAQLTYIDTCNKLREFGIDHIFGERLQNDFPQYQRLFLREYLQENVYGYLAPYVVDANSPFPYLEEGKLYVVVELETKAKKKKGKKKAGKSKGAEGDLCNGCGTKLGIIALPDQCVRLIELPCGDGKNIVSADTRSMLLPDEEQISPYAFVLLEDALCLFAKDIFPKYKVLSSSVVSLVRNADLGRFDHIDKDDGDYLAEMDAELVRRDHKAPLMLMTSGGIEGSACKVLQDGLGIKAHQMQMSGLPLDMDYAAKLSEHLSESMRERLSFSKCTPKWLRTGPMRLNPNHSILDQLSMHDALLMYPYESMDPFLMMLREAVDDPGVSAIDITLYRLARDSEVAASLMDAARAGKRVRVVIELRAGFDESENIAWAHRFKQVGCEVIYGLEDCKVHGKICCITRSVDGALRHITQIGTGNYNEITSKSYTDFSFMTSDSDIGRDAHRLFDNLERGVVSDEYKSLIVSPLQLRKAIIRQIDGQIARAKAGESSGVFFKVNAITDKDVIEKLVEASNAGVAVVMIVRDSCCILPGVEGCTEKVRVASLVGRLLEHSRIYGFGAWDDMKIYLSSADLMKRNMDHRVEIAWPVRNNTLRKRVIQYANLCLNDTAKLRELLPDGSYTALGALAKEDAAGRKELFDSQEYLLRKG